MNADNGRLAFNSNEPLKSESLEVGKGDLPPPKLEWLAPNFHEIC